MRAEKMEGWVKCGDALLKRTHGLLDPAEVKSAAQKTEIKDIETELAKQVKRMQALQTAAPRRQQPTAWQCQCCVWLELDKVHDHVEGNHFRNCLKQARPCDLMLEVEKAGPDLRTLLDAQDAGPLVAKLEAVLKEGTGVGDAKVGDAADLKNVANSWLKCGSQDASRRLDGALRALAAVVRSPGDPDAKTAKGALWAIPSGFHCVAAALEDNGQGKLQCTPLGRLLLRCLDVDAGLMQAMWNATALAAITVASGGCRLLVRASFNIGESGKANFSNFVGDIPHCQGRKTVEYRKALKLLRDQAPEQVEPGEPAERPAVERHGAEPHLRRRRTGPGLASPWHFDSLFDVHGAPVPAPPLAAFPLAFTAEESERVRRIGILVELIGAGARASHTGPLRGRGAETQAGVDAAWARCRAMRVTMLDAKGGVMLVDPSHEEMEEARAAWCTALLGLDEEGYEIGELIVWYELDSGVRGNVDATVVRRSDGAKFGLDIHRFGYAHVDARDTMQGKEKVKLCERRFRDLKRLGDDCPAALQNLRGFVVAHVMGHQIALHTYEPDRADREDAAGAGLLLDLG